MSKYVSKFWITFTLILSIVFIALFVPLTVESIGIVKTVVYTLIALLVIWGVYFIRAYIFSNYDSTHKK